MRRPPLAARFALDAARRIAAGRLVLSLPDGSRHEFAGPEPGPAADLTVRDWRLFRRVMSGGDIGLAEAYMAGDCETSDLTALLSLLAVNEERLASVAQPGLLRRAALRLGHLLRDNSRRGARRNIHAHYDLGNRFYELWLDRTMTYSSALFDAGAHETPARAPAGGAPPPHGALESAQEAKYGRILDRLGARPGETLLEIGCGWGGFAEAAARRGVHVTGVTISREQLAYARERLARQGLGEAARIEFRDYRDIIGAYDHVVSIEMVEAVGERHWPEYFGALKRHLNPGGTALVQAIVIADGFFERYRSQADFIQTYIFPGGMLLSPGAIAEQARRAGLRLAAAHGFGADYARTLEAWLHRFDGVADRIASLGFDERFRRMWRWYLAYCAAGFATRRTDVLQVELRHI